MEQEQKHFRECQELIRQNIIKYEEKTREARKETEELYAAFTSGDVELYNQLIVSQNIQEHNENMLRKNKAALQKPYFGRIDYQETEEMEDGTFRNSGQKERLYIGKNGISRDKTDVVIVDWRAPVSTLYYENELGQGCYYVPEVGKIPVELQLKRTFDVNQGELLGYYDNDTAATDELLVKYLSKNKDVILGDIISTIQKEQNEIIRETPFTNVIVQGVAGSGKTTVAMHRISYILYNYEKRFSPEEFCIIGSNDMLLGYITSGLPELDVHHVGQKRMDLFFRDLLGKEWKKKYTITAAGAEAACKSKMEFVQKLEAYLQEIRDRLIPAKAVADKGLGVILSEESIQATLQENKNASVHQLFKLLNDRLKNRIRFMVSEDNPDYCKEKCREYAKFFKWETGQKDIVKIYTNFLAEYERTHDISLSETTEQVKKGKFDVYDVASLVLVQKRISETGVHDEYGQIMIDEAQDFGAMVYYVLKEVLQSCYFTIMGDVSQNINYETGMNRWDDLQQLVFEPERTRFRMLAKSYRNTIEISEYAGRVLEKASFGEYRIQPVIRHGRAVEFYQAKKLAEKTAVLIEDIRTRGYDTMAVICRTEAEAEKVRLELEKYVELETKGEHEAKLESKGDEMKSDRNEEGFQKGVMVLPIHLTKGLEFDAVILWNPDEASYGENEGDAKLLYVAVTRALHELHVVYDKGLTRLFDVTL